MNKFVIALAATSCMTGSIVAQADATLYGGVETRLEIFENRDMDLSVNKAELGVKGTSALEGWDGVKARYQIEFRLDADGTSDTAALNSNVNGDVKMRKANVGLEGDFGIIQIGRQNNLGNAIKKADKFMTTPDNYKTSDRVGNTIYYVTPRFGGFEGYAGLIIDGAGNDNEEDVDAWQAGFNYSLSGLDLSVAYTEIDGNYKNGSMDHTSGENIELWGVGASYAIDDLTLAATYEHQDQGSSEDEMYFLMAKYGIGNAYLQTGFSQNFVAGVDNNDFDTYVAQVGYKLGKKAEVKAEYTVKDPDDSNIDDTDFITLSYAVIF